MGAEMSINVILKRAGAPLACVEIPNTLEALQRLVGGYIEIPAYLPAHLKLPKGLDVVINEEGRLSRLPVNFAVVEDSAILDTIHGAVVCARVDGDGEFVSIQPGDLEAVQKALASEGVR